MAQTELRQLNIRSAFARERAAGLARITGMSLTRVVEEALRAYQPVQKVPTQGNLVMKGSILVKPKSGRMVSAADVELLLEDVRSEHGRSELG